MIDGGRKTSSGWPVNCSGKVFNSCHKTSPGIIWQPFIELRDLKCSTSSGSISITANPLTNGNILSENSYVIIYTPSIFE